MTEGATQSVEQTDAPASTPTGKPERKSMWERLKPLWWVRGIVTAFALVGLCDSLGLVRQDWLRVFHAIGARWNDWMGWLATSISQWLPFDWALSNFELTALTVMFATGFPSAIAWAANDYRKAGRLTFDMIAPIMFGAMIVAFSISLLSNDQVANVPLTPDPLLLALLAALIMLPMPILWTDARGYLKVLVGAITFLATLELFFLAPFLQAWLEPIVDWIDPAGAKP